MELSNVELTRCDIDQEYDGFFDFIKIESIGNQYIVCRENHDWLGIVDESGNILLPLIYDKLTPKVYGVETTVVDNNGELYGLYSTNDRSIIFPARYDFLYPVTDYFWCLEKHQWKLMARNFKEMWSLPDNVFPLDHNKYICVLVKNHNNFNIMVLDDEYNYSQRGLRKLAHESNISNRIKMTSIYYNLIVYSDIYGNVIYSNVDINKLFFS